MGVARFSQGVEPRARQAKVRLTGGQLAGRRLRSAPAGVRPTSDRVRESMFAWLDCWQDAHVLDLYAGTGTLGLEALSRGAREVVFVDHSAAALRVLKANLDALGVRSATRVRKSDAQRAFRELERRAGSFDVVLLDPPYASEELAWALPRLAEARCLAAQGLIVVERDRRGDLPLPAGLRRMDSRGYGDTLIDVLERCEVG